MYSIFFLYANTVVKSLSNIFIQFSIFQKNFKRKSGLGFHSIYKIS